jgi:hypothetical protein
MVKNIQTTTSIKIETLKQLRMFKVVHGFLNNDAAIKASMNAYTFGVKG